MLFVVSGRLFPEDFPPVFARHDELCRVDARAVDRKRGEATEETTAPPCTYLRASSNEMSDLAAK
jgi:hypothetical protein